jgi:predicted ATPase
MDKLKKIYLNGYKSVRYDAQLIRSSVDAESEVYRGEVIEFGDITVLLGANGAGKSNLVSFFKMLNFMTTGSLQEYIGREGGSNCLLHYGRQVTPRMQAEIEFTTTSRTSRRTCYMMTLADAAPDTLIFTNEAVEFQREEFTRPQEVVLGAGHRESRLKERADHGDHTCKVIYGMLARCRTYQFHDTSQTANIRKAGYIEDADYLRADSGNLAAYLLTVKQANRQYYDRIIQTIRLVFPQFDDFVLEPSPRNEKYILLNWREKGRPEYLFGPHQLSDGTLRFMALATLFLQPIHKLPSVIIIDEPELGLHPYAIAVLASMIQSAAARCQVVLSTQSTRLVDEFDLGQIVVVERNDQMNCTRCRRPDVKALEDWIDRYTTSELWEKNVLGGRP